MFNFVSQLQMHIAIQSHQKHQKMLPAHHKNLRKKYLLRRTRQNRSIIRYLCQILLSNMLMWPNLPKIKSAHIIVSTSQVKHPPDMMIHCVVKSLAMCIHNTIRSLGNERSRVKAELNVICGDFICRKVQYS